MQKAGVRAGGASLCPYLCVGLQGVQESSKDCRGGRPISSCNSCPSASNHRPVLVLWGSCGPGPQFLLFLFSSILQAESQLWGPLSPLLVT